MIAALLALAPLVQDDLQGRTLAEWRALLEPTAQERAYEEIPWQPTFWGAVEQANEEQRPVLLWAMNGHPLGCT